MASDSDLSWSQVPIGATLILTNTGGQGGLVNATVDYEPVTDPPTTHQLSEGPIVGTLTYTLKAGYYSVRWLIVAVADENGFSGAAGFSAQVVNPDGTTNGATVTASCTTASDPSNQSGYLTIEVPTT